MAASFGGGGGVEGGYDDCDSEEGGEEEEGGGSGAYGEAPFRFRTSEVAPWGEGDRPLIKVRCLLEDIVRAHERPLAVVHSRSMRAPADLVAACC